MEGFTLKQESLGRQILKDANVATIDPMSILIILRIIISILIFLGDNWSEPKKLPIWKKAVIKFELMRKFGRTKAREIEKLIYSNIEEMTPEEVKGLVEVQVR